MKTTIRIDLMAGEPDPSGLLELSEIELPYHGEMAVNQEDIVEIQKSGHIPILLAKVLNVETKKDYKILKLVITTAIF